MFKIKSTDYQGQKVACYSMPIHRRLIETVLHGILQLNINSS